MVISWKLADPMFRLLSLCLIIQQLSSGHRGQQGVVEAAGGIPLHHQRRSPMQGGRPPPPPLKLFVFGDSYADTGNVGKSQGSSWNVPYGITFPGKPAGRFSDGRVFTDFLAKYLGLRTPVAYRWRKVVPLESTRYGINFATGGTGVFDTLSGGPNMSRQIDMFQSLMRKGGGSAADLRFSVALVSLSGNDYAAYLVKNGSIPELPAFISQVVNQLAADVKRIHELGVRRVAVSGLAPLGCLPAITATSSYQQCNDTFNALVALHNQLLQQAVAQLNRNRRGADEEKLSAPADFILLDLYSSFASVLINPKGNPMFENPLKPCCAGTITGYYCGSVDGETREKRYTVCSNPGRAFFWDVYHPTQEGWRAVFSNLRDTLQQLLIN